MSRLPDYSVDILGEKNHRENLWQMSPGSFLLDLKDMNNGTLWAMLEGLSSISSEMIIPGERFYAPNLSIGRDCFPEC